MKQYVTFGQAHIHVIDGVVFDTNCVATYEAADWRTGRAHAFALFGPKFCMHYAEEDAPLDRMMPYYSPRGLIEAPPPVLDQVASGSTDP